MNKADKGFSLVMTGQEIEANGMVNKSNKNTFKYLLHQILLIYIFINLSATLPEILMLPINCNKEDCLIFPNHMLCKVQCKWRRAHFCFKYQS